MAKDVDLTSREWRDLIFQGKNKEFGAYEIRRKSDRRHNIALITILILIAAIGITLAAVVAINEYIKAEEEKISAIDEMSQIAAEMPEEEEAEEELIQQEEEKLPEVQEEVLTTTQVTEIAIVDKVTNELKSMDEQMADNNARGTVDQVGTTDDVTKAIQVQEKVEIVEEVKPEPKKEEEIFVAVEQQAQFPGGQQKLMQWLSNNVRYPQISLQNEVQGRVIVKFVVEKDGSVSGAQILRGVDKDLDREALRVVRSMPKWQPGKNNGVAVRSWFTLPVNFKIQQQ